MTKGERYRPASADRAAAPSPAAPSPAAENASRRTPDLKRVDCPDCCGGGYDENTGDSCDTCNGHGHLYREAK